MIDQSKTKTYVLSLLYDAYDVELVWHITQRQPILFLGSLFVCTVDFVFAHLVIVINSSVIEERTSGCTTTLLVDDVASHGCECVDKEQKINKKWDWISQYWIKKTRKEI